MIGIFDSGYGGLSVFKEIEKELPQYNYLYLGDNARAPYGNRTPAVIYQYTRQACAWLFSQGCELIILACNTASAGALRKLQQEYLPQKYPAKRILGVLIPLAEEISKSVAPEDTIGIIGTQATIESRAYVNELQKFGLTNTIIEQTCPLLVPLIEDGRIHDPITTQIIREYLAPLKKASVNILILGCTHYPFVINAIKKEMGEGCRIPEPGKVVAQSLINYLERHPEIETKLSKEGLRRFITTDNPKKFKEFAKTMAGMSVDVERLQF